MHNNPNLMILAFFGAVQFLMLWRLHDMPTIDDLKAGQAAAVQAMQDAVDELGSIEGTMNDLAAKLAAAVADDDTDAIEAISADLTAHAQATSAAVQAAKDAQAAVTALPPPAAAPDGGQPA